MNNKTSQENISQSNSPPHHKVSQGITPPQGITSREKASRRCISMNRFHERCLNMTKCDSGFCNSHKIKIFEKPEECPICMESLENERVPLSCGHWVHMECLGNLDKYDCPLCRKNIKSCLPKDILAKIKINKNKNLEEEELSQINLIRTFMREYIDEYILNGNELSVSNENVIELDRFSIIVENADLVNIQDILDAIRLDDFVLT